MTPSSFRNLRALEHLNVAGVGLSLAALTAAIGLHLDGNPGTAFGVGAPTLVLGTLWARLLRWPRTLMGTSLRVAWLLSVPLAAANAALAAALVFGGAESRLRVGEVLMFLAIGATFGVVVWGPALVMTLLCFGLPLAWAQRSAREGLSGQERGELVVGAACALLSLAAMWLTLGYRPSPAHDLTGLWFTRAMAVAGVACAGAAVAISAARARHRRAFVADVEAGRVERFRVDTTGEGRALVRVVSQGQAYRVRDVEEEVAALDVEGRVTRRRDGSS